MKKYIATTLALSLVFAPALKSVEAKQTVKSKSEKIKKLDKDKNGLDDAWQKKYHLGTGKNVSSKDNDKDGLNNTLEYKLHLNPLSQDSDKDKILDINEDTDQDGITNGGELADGTNPADADTDNDGVKDGNEDHDHDGIKDKNELRNLEIRLIDESGKKLYINFQNHKGKVYVKVVKNELGITNVEDTVKSLAITPTETKDELANQIVTAFGLTNVKELKVSVEFGSGHEKEVEKHHDDQDDEQEQD